MTEEYQGRVSVRGISCDHWISTLSQGPVNMTLDWYFSSVDWSIPQSNGSRIPVRLILTGSSPAARPGSSTPPPHTFYHVYEYTSFHVGLGGGGGDAGGGGGHHQHQQHSSGSTSADIFTVGCGTTCNRTLGGGNFTQPPQPSHCDRPPPASGSGISSGAVAGVAVACLLAGGLVTSLVMYLVQRRRKSGPGYSPQLN